MSYLKLWLKLMRAGIKIKCKMTKLLYHQSYESFSTNLQTLKVKDWVENKAKVLEFGCHTGLLSKYLLEKKEAEVIGIDINSEALKQAKNYQALSIKADIENIEDWKNQLENKSFDVITFLHILEHLRNSHQVLMQTKKLLNANGTVIIGLPNVSNAKDRFNMTFGKFEYTDIGVMDRTHVHMFNYKTATKFIEDAGLIIEEYYSPWQVNPVKHFLDHLPAFNRIARKMNERPPKFFKFSPNITDSVMLFKCKLLSK